ncbi:MAG: fluoride efflux transporter CrcB [Chitinophagaceae bacterium]|nr:fluoride efflux transporter CrcB [Chitinophagaceae bacterium]
MIKNLLLVGLGGGLGSMARYLCQRWFSIAFPNHFPWGTLVVNVSGCLLIGIFWGIGLKQIAVNENWKLFLLTGICGGYTTFSAFTLESIGLLREERTGLFFAYILASVVVGLLATYVGIRISSYT